MKSLGFVYEELDEGLTILRELFEDGSRSFTNLYEWNNEGAQ